MFGTYKGKTGITEQKLGGKWTCKLDCVAERQSFKSEQLHATAPAASDATLTAFEPKVLDAALPVGEIAAFISNLQLDPDQPVELRRLHPESGTMLDLMTRVLLPSELDDDMLRRLRYKASGPPVELSSKDGALSAEERQALIQGLQRTVQGAWTIKVGCARFADCGCPYALEFRHNLDGTATVSQTEDHQFHNPSSPEDLAKLSMHPTLRDLGWVLLECGVAPMMVRFQLNLRAQQEGLQGSSGSNVVMQASNARCNITISQVYALAKQMRRAAGVGVTSDAAAIEAMVAEYRQQGILPYYQPYRAGSSSKPSQPLVIVVQTPFQARMLAQFGCALVFCDSTYGVNKRGYPLYALVVQDDVGRGVPVGFMVCSSDTVEVVHQFLEALRQGAQKAGGSPDFTYGWIMIDKSKTEIAAVRLLTLAGNAKGHLLCYFHFLQDWERFLVSKESGVSSKEDKNSIMVALAELAGCGSEAVFKAKVEEFCAAYRRWPKVLAKLRKDWVPCAADWGRWGAGRQDPAVAAMAQDTNNLCERNFGVVKYTDLQRKAQSTIQQLLDTLLTVTVARCMQQRALQLAGRASSDHVQRARRTEQWVQRLVSEGAVVPAAADSELGRATVEGGDSSHVVYLGDLSCSCSYSAEHLCVHLTAAARKLGFTHKRRLAAAAHLALSGSIELHGEANICSCPTLADVSRKQTFRPEEGFCTCHDRLLNGTCCHLLAAPLLTAFSGIQVLTGAPPPADVDQHIEISGQRTFQQASSEPLGEDWQAELKQLRAAKASAAAAIQQAQTNADPAVAQLRSDAAYVQRTVAALPQGEDRQALLDMSAELRRKAKAAAAAAGLQPTEVRAGKQQRRADLRGPTDRKVKPLLPRQKGDGSTLRQRRGGQQQQQEVAPEDRCDPLPKATKRGKQVDKKRGLTIKGNVDGTVIRNGAAHTRYSAGKKQKQQ